jgi:hypothetical protein
MPKFPVQLVAALALAGVSLGDFSSAPAQESAPANPGVIAPQREPITEAEPLPIPGYPAASPESAATSNADGSSQGYYVANPAGWSYPLLPDGSTAIRRGKNWYGYENEGPWLRPIRNPIDRVPVQYARYWPTSYYTGASDPNAQYAQALPVVYQPTDTTQLGFTYQRVPQWQPRPNAIPSAPWPPTWHYVIPVGPRYHP